MIKTVVLSLLSFFSLSILQAQSLKTWFGEWKGTLELYKPDGTVDRTVPMELLVKPTKDSSVVQWKIVYNTQDVRDYTLRIVDTLAGKYTLDEQNGITVDVRRYGNILMSSFDVQGYQIWDSYEMRGITMIFTLTSSNTKLHTESGKGTEESPNVVSKPINVFQRAVLFRQ